MNNSQISNSSNRFRSVSKTPNQFSKKDLKKAKLMNNIQGFGSTPAGRKDSHKSIVR